jgi:serralysin
VLITRRMAMWMMLFTGAVTPGSTQSVTNNVPGPPLRICSTKDPKEVDRKLDSMKKLFGATASIESLDDVQKADSRAVSDSVQQAAVKPKLWTPGSTIKVAFLSGDPVVRARIQQSAMKWTAYLNLGLDFIDDPTQAAIRIGVDLNGKSESQIGLDSETIPVSKETMHFGWLTADSSQADYDSVVLHEFGHAFGAIHEHQIPSSTIIWNKPLVYQYCLEQWGWSTDDVDHNIFEKYSPDQLIFTRMDPDSIMMYSFPAAWTLNDPPMSTPWNYKLSPADIQFMSSLYPRAPALQPGTSLGKKPINHLDISSHQ